MEIIEKIKQVANIVELASAYTTLRRRGQKFFGLCPFHAERNPSFTVDEEKQLYHCFGCGAGGDIFSLIMEKENLSFLEAIRFLAEKYHLPLPQPARLNPEVKKLEARLYEINELALTFFRRQLHQTAEGQKALFYLRQRGLDDKTIDELRLGYAPSSWNSLVNFLKEKGVTFQEILKAGLALPSQKNQEIYDRFRGRIIFPIFSLSGRVIAFGGRILGEGEPKYLNSPDTPVYTKGQVLYGLNLTKEAIRTAQELILVEGYMDFIALYQAGLRNCVASCGTSLTVQQVSLAQRFASTIIISPDGDEAGQNAAVRAVSICLEKGMPSKVVILPEKMDPDSFLRQRGKEAYLKLVRQPFLGFDFLLNNTNQNSKICLLNLALR
ncbi:MAG: DNA primase [Candidatus Aminicenantes bacterium]|nr:DNA primase [Candidatus Aminicenantes bacterium]